MKFEKNAKNHKQLIKVGQYKHYHKSPNRGNKYFILCYNDISMYV